MRLRIVLLLSIALATLPLAVLAKGPAGAEIDGPGLSGPISFSAFSESGMTDFSRFTEMSGIFPATFGQMPSPMLKAAPKGDLGPEYRVTWDLPGPKTAAIIEQSLYPYAEGGPLVYTAPDQAFWEAETAGGWYRAPIALKTLLEEYGLSPQAPAAGTGSSSLAVWQQIVSAVAVALAAALVARAAKAGRPRPVPTA